MNYVNSGKIAHSGSSQDVQSLDKFVAISKDRIRSHIKAHIRSHMQAHIRSHIKSHIQNHIETQMQKIFRTL